MKYIAKGEVKIQTEAIKSPSNFCSMLQVLKSGIYKVWEQFLFNVTSSNLRVAFVKSGSNFCSMLQVLKSGICKVWNPSLKKYWEEHYFILKE